jgi:hypothetical protein
MARTKLRPKLDARRTWVIEYLWLELNYGLNWMQALRYNAVPWLQLQIT